MNTSLIVNLNKHNVYYINGNKLGFYIALPNGGLESTNISIELYPDYDKLDPNNSDGVWLKDEVTRIYKEVDNYNISLVIPIFHDDSLKRTDTQMDQNLYLQLDAELSSVINSSYQMISKSNVKVENKIFLINNGSYNNFCRWFLQRYGTRIEYKSYTDFGGTPAVPTPVQQPFSNPVEAVNVNVQSQSTAPSSEQAYMGVPNPTQPVAPPPPSNGMEFVTGNNMGTTPIIEPPVLGQMNNTPNNENVEVPQAGSAGFVSYLLLGIITVIICLGVLYIML